MVNPTEANDEVSVNSSRPKNSLTPREENNRILAYSAKKISTNPTEEYSILNPETSSDSPSEKSKGVRFVSAIIITNQSTETAGTKHTIALEPDSMEHKFNLIDSKPMIIRINDRLIS